jgi:multifunctional beta-oxidation protein
VPNAGTAMTATVWPEEYVKAFSPDFVAPVVGYLGSEACETTMGLYEVSAGWCASIRWQRTYGYAVSTGRRTKPTSKTDPGRARRLPQFPVNKKVQPEDLKSKWDVITRFDDKATYPNSTAESLEAIISNFANEAANDDDSTDYTDPEDSELVAKAKKEAQASGEYVYTERDVALYNIGVGATEKDLDLIFEQDENFQALPSFGVIPQCESAGLSRVKGQVLTLAPKQSPSRPAFLVSSSNRHLSPSRKLTTITRSRLASQLFAHDAPARRAVPQDPRAVPDFG